MQQCTICSSNPNNKTYNYQTFEPDEYVKPTSYTGFIIEGLDSISQTSMVSDSATNLNISNAKHIECSLANQSLCNDLNKKYNDKVAIVAELEPAYTAAQTAYDSCNNHKNRCIGIERVIKNTQRTINLHDFRIAQNTKLLDTCEPHKERCNKLNQQIVDKKKQIEDLRGYIATNEGLYKKNMCAA